MNFVKNIFCAVIYSNVYLAAASACLSIGMAQYLQTDLSLERIFIAFSIPLMYYNLCQFIGLKGKEKEDMSPLQQWVATNMTELLFGLFFIFITSFYFIYQLSLFENFIPLILLGVIGFLYLYFNSSIQNTILLKPILISVSWLVLQLFIVDSFNLFEEPFLAIIVCIYFFNLCFVYDNKDVNSRSILTHIGQKGAIALSIGIHFLIFILTQKLQHPLHLLWVLIWLMISLVILIIGIRKSEEWWHLIFTDGLIYCLAYVLVMN